MRFLGLALAITTFISGTAVSQTIELNKCVSWGETGWPDCGRVPGQFFDFCSNTTFGTFWGRYAWYPLDYVGPITIELETEAT